VSIRTDSVICAKLAGMPFTGPVVVQEVDRGDGSRWQLVEPLTYQGRDELFVVAAEFETDFASVPRAFTWLIPRYGRYTKAAILHDFLSQRAAAGELAWVDADGIFRRVMRELGVPLLRRWLMWAAVRLRSVVEFAPSSLWTQGPGPLVALVVITVLGIAFLAVPAVVVTVWTLAFALLEVIAYVPARLVRRSDRVNAPRPMLPR
jgi:hypothetical protein